MRALVTWVALAVATTACGAQVESKTVPASDAATSDASGSDAESTDAESTDAASEVGPAPWSSEGGAGPWAGMGCPNVPPATKSICTGESPGDHFYCLYFPLGMGCSLAWKCTDSGSMPTVFQGGDEDCTTKYPDCDEGKPCGLMGGGVPGLSPGACFVQCERACHCDVKTNKLKCEPAPCE